jgi:hypothetical protein
LEELNQIKDETGNQLVAQFKSKVSEEKQALRFANPFLDAWLYYFGYTTSFKTKKSEVAFKSICNSTGRMVTQ